MSLHSKKSQMLAAKSVKLSAQKTLRAAKNVYKAAADDNKKARNITGDEFCEIVESADLEKMHSSFDIDYENLSSRVGRGSLNDLIKEQEADGKALATLVRKLTLRKIKILHELVGAVDAHQHPDKVTKFIKLKGKL
jgi:hypothetical protein